jgi:predicted MFS family arabinose efflux permease
LLAMIGSGVALGLAFVWHARHADEPFLPLSLIGGKVVPWGMLTSGFALGAMIGLTVYLPLYYEVVYHLTASQAGLGLIPLAAISTFGAAIAGRTMARVKHYKRVAIAGTTIATVAAAVMTVTTPSLWGLMALLAVFGVGLGTPFPICVVALQNAVPRAQIGTITGAMNFYRSMVSSFTVAAFGAILLMTLGADISLAEGASGTVSGIAPADMVHAFRFVFGAATLMLAGAAICMTLMEERPLAGPAARPDAAAAAMME